VSIRVIISARYGVIQLETDFDLTCRWYTHDTPIPFIPNISTLLQRFFITYAQPINTLLTSSQGDSKLTHTPLLQVHTHNPRIPHKTIQPDHQFSKILLWSHIIPSQSQTQSHINDRFREPRQGNLRSCSFPISVILDNLE
jgi:hypothetical protein